MGSASPQPAVAQADAARSGGRHDRRDSAGDPPAMVVGFWSFDVMLYASVVAPGHGIWHWLLPTVRARI